MAHASRGEKIAKLQQKDFLRFRIPAPDVADPREQAETEKKFEAVLARVNAAKVQMDEPSIHEAVVAVLGAVDLYKGLRWMVERDCGGQLVTNAWLKIHEILTQAELVPEGEEEVRAFFNAELPGAFAAATNHYMKTQRPGTRYDWVASSYYPPEAPKSQTEREILGDKYEVYARNRDHWLMDPPGSEKKQPNTGDVTDAANIEDLAARARAHFGGRGATLYTSDAGIDVSEDYSRQEEATSLLNFGQILLGLAALAEGGDLVTKQYTFSRPFSHSLLSLLSSLFVELAVVKPLTSRPPNSEVFIVGKGFRGISKPLLARLLKRLAHCKEHGVEPTALGGLWDLVPYSAESAAALLRATTRIHAEQQVAFIDEAVGFARRFGRGVGPLKESLRDVARRDQKAWLRNNPVGKLAPVDRLPAKS